jgi:hypothetical protein
MRMERRSTTRTTRGWAILVLQEAGAIRQCEEHGWIVDRGDPHACERAMFLARQVAPEGLTSTEAVAALKDVLDGIGDTCPECRAG